jgi:hypothetical protein
MYGEARASQPKTYYRLAARPRTSRTPGRTSSCTRFGNHRPAPVRPRDPRTNGVGYTVVRGTITVSMPA